MSATIAPPERLTDESDEDLFGRFRAADDTAAFEALVYRYERELFGYLRRSLRTAELAEDVFQATFLRIHVSRDSFEEGRSFRPWLYSIATNQAIDALRRERRHRRVRQESAATAGEEVSLFDTVAAAGDTPAEQAGLQEERRRIRKAVRRLSAMQRRVVHLVYDRGLAYREAAAVLGVPIGTVKSRLHAAIQSLGRIMAGESPKRAYAMAAKSL